MRDPPSYFDRSVLLRSEAQYWRCLDNGHAHTTTTSECPYWQMSALSKEIPRHSEQKNAAKRKEYMSSLQAPPGQGKGKGSLRATTPSNSGPSGASYSQNTHRPPYADPNLQYQQQGGPELQAKSQHKCQGRK